jgi:hypothetical protein
MHQKSNVKNTEIRFKEGIAKLPAAEKKALEKYPRKRYTHS